MQCEVWRFRAKRSKNLQRQRNDIPLL